jgi:hypothetical protein
MCAVRPDESEENGAMKLKAKIVTKASREKEPEASNQPTVPSGYRRLKWNEVVSVGDFVADGHQGFIPWEGPGGFRADSFEKTIYRQSGGHVPAAKKSK